MAQIDCKSRFEAYGSFQRAQSLKQSNPFANNLNAPFELEFDQISGPIYAMRLQFG